MGVFNFFIVIPQIVAAAILGFFVTHVFNSQSIYALVVGGVSMIIAGLLNFIVRDKGHESSSEIVQEVMETEQSPPTYI